MTSTISHQDAAAAAKAILGLYPEIPASDPKGFAAALVAMLSTYPQSVIKRAVDPVNGIASKLAFLNLAAIKKHLDQWADEEYEEVRRRNRRNLQLPEPPSDPQVQQRIKDGFAKLSEHLKRGFGPSTAAE